MDCGLWIERVEMGTRRVSDFQDFLFLFLVPFDFVFLLLLIG